MDSRTGGCRLDHRVDGRNQVADVSEIRATHNLVIVGRHHVTPEGRRVGHVCIQERLVVSDLVVGGLDQLVGHGAAAGKCAGLKACDDSLCQLVGTRTVGRPHVPTGRCPLGDDVGALPGLGEYPVDPLLWGDVLTQGSHVHVAQNCCIESIPAELWSRSCMRRTPGVDDPDLLYCEAGDISEVCIGGVNHHCGVNAVKGSPLQHQDLAAASLLCGCTENSYLTTHLLADGRCGQAGSESGGGNNVVTARMAYSG